MVSDFFFQKIFLIRRMRWETPVEKRSKQNRNGKPVENYAPQDGPVRKHPFTIPIRSTPYNKHMCESETRHSRVRRSSYMHRMNGPGRIVACDVWDCRGYVPKIKDRIHANLHMRTYLSLVCAYLAARNAAATYLMWSAETEVGAFFFLTYFRFGRWFLMFF